VTPEEVPQDLVDAATFAFAAKAQVDGNTGFIDYARTMLAVVLPLHEKQVRAQLLAEQEQERRGAYAGAEQKFLDAWNAALRNGALRILPDGALTWRRRTPGERRVYLTEHREEALAYGIPADLVDLMIGDAEAAGND
jgi:hypothetical protein